MTIVVAGYESEQDIFDRKYMDILTGEELSEEEAAQLDEGQREDYLKMLRSPKRAYVFADSLLSRKAPHGRDVTADTAEKVTEIDIVLSVPEFRPYGQPSGRYHIHRSTKCGVAFAGATALQSLTLDKFRKIAKSFRYTWIGNGGTCGYAICQADSKEDLAHPENSSTEFDEEIDFDDRSLPKLDSGIVLQAFIDAFDGALKDHVIKEAWNRQAQHDAPVDGEFVLLIYCENSQKPIIYLVKYSQDTSVFPTGFKSTHQELAWNQLAVLGMPSATDQLKAIRDEAIKSSASIGKFISGCVENIIRNNEGKNYIGGRLQGGMLTREGFSLIY